MYREINTEKIKTLVKDLLDTVSEIKSITTIEEEVFVKERKNIYSLRYLLIGAVEAMANICNHILTRVTGQVPKVILTASKNYLKPRSLQGNLVTS